MIQVIRKTIEYIPDLSNPTENLLERFQEQYTNTCSRQYGFILKIIRVVGIVSSKISIYNAHNIVECEIEVYSLIPQIGETLSGTIQQIFPQGLILLVENCMKVFIPSPKKVYTPKQIIEFEVIQTRFQKGKYDCIGKEKS
jgi:DNA-directed RNA polymerase subunit E'/Rpb7